MGKKRTEAKCQKKRKIKKKKRNEKIGKFFLEKEKKSKYKANCRRNTKM